MAHITAIWVLTTTTATLHTAVYYFQLCTILRYRSDVCWRTYIVEYRMVF